MKKRKPYLRGARVLHPPPKREQDVARPGWLWDYPYTYISLMGKVRWHSTRHAWYGYLTRMNHCSGPYNHPYHGFTKARDAMAWVEREYERRDRNKTWKSTET